MKYNNQNEQKSKVLMSNIMLVIASAIWGSCFLFQKLAATEIGAFTFMCGRTTLGVLTLSILITYTECQRKNAAIQCGEIPVAYGKAYFKKLFLVAPFCGIINVSGSVLVQIGLVSTTASKAGFINAIYIIFVPIIGLLLFKQKTGINVIFGVLFAVIGLYHLCIDGSLGSIQKGDLIILCSTLLFALHIHLVSKYVRELVGIHFSCAEFAFAALFCGVMAFIFEKPTVAQISGCGISILYAGVLGIGVCYALQVTAQKYTDPTVAALLMSLESVFSAICGVLFLKESFTGREFIGILFIVIAIIVAQLPQKRKKGGYDEKTISEGDY